MGHSSIRIEHPKKVKAQFALPELQDKRLMEWNLHVAKDMGACDMIIGRDMGHVVFPEDWH